MFAYSVLIPLAVYFVCETDSKGPGYIFNNEFARGISGNSSWLTLRYFKFGQYNRTVKTANFELDLAMDVTREDDVLIYFEFAIFKNNEYKKTPIKFPKKLCEILGTTLFDIPNLTKNSTFRSCPLYKGLNYGYDLTLTSNGWPKLLPEGRFMMTLDFMYKNVLIIKIEWFLQIIADH